MPYSVCSFTGEPQKGLKIRLYFLTQGDIGVVGV
jgi:hypothetical protein